MAKMSRTEISAKILKRKKNQNFYYQNHTKSFSAHGHRILAAILDFVEEVQKRKKKLPGKFPRASMHTENIWK